MLPSAPRTAADLFISSSKYFFYFFDRHPRSYLPRDLTKFGGSSSLIDHKADTCHSSLGRARHHSFRSLENGLITHLDTRDVVVS